MGKGSVLIVGGNRHNCKTCIRSVSNNEELSSQRERKRKRKRDSQKDEEREKSEWRILAYQIVFVITVIAVRRGSRRVVLPAIDKLSSRAESDMISAGANRPATTHLVGQLRLDLEHPSIVE